MHINLIKVKYFKKINDIVNVRPHFFKTISINFIS